MDKEVNSLIKEKLTWENKYLSKLRVKKDLLEKKLKEMKVDTESDALDVVGYEIGILTMELDIHTKEKYTAKYQEDVDKFEKEHKANVKAADNNFQTALARCKKVRDILDPQYQAILDSIVTKKGFKDDYEKVTYYKTLQNLLKVAEQTIKAQAESAKPKEKKIQEQPPA